MSDLISTPSQTQSPVSNEAFEALIDLIASDGVDENVPAFPGDRSSTQPNTTLRDASGKLDFNRIRQMFAAKNGSHLVFTTAEPSGEEQNGVWPMEDGDSNDEHRSQRSMASTIPSRASSMSPKPAERTAASTCHRRSSTFGNQPWAAMPENAPPLPAKGDVAPTHSHQPLSFDELNTALAGAHEEVRNLRQQYDELQALVSKRFGGERRDRVEPFPNATNADSKQVETRDTDSQAQPSAVMPPVPLPSDVPTAIASLSGNEAKTALSALARSLNLSLDTISSMADPSTSIAPVSSHQSLSLPIPTREYDVASLNRAVMFLGTVDELVWRRSSGPSGPRTLLPVYSEENAVALIARLGLWERAVRRSSRI